MGVISLALIANGDISSTHFAVPLWVKLACAVAIASGTAIGGWRIINTMGNRLTTVESPQGFSAESASASVILASSYFGYPLSTTHVVSGGVIGSGLGKRLASVHWGVAGQMATAWVFTIPAAGVMGAFAWGVSDLFGNGQRRRVADHRRARRRSGGHALPPGPAQQHLGRRPRPLARDARGRGAARRRRARADIVRSRRDRIGKIGPMLATALINTTALWKIILASLLGGVGVVVAFGFLLLGLSKANQAKGRPGEQAGYYLISGVCGLFCVAAVAVGIYAMAKKPSSPAPKPAKTTAASVGRGTVG